MVEKPSGGAVLFLKAGAVTFESLAQGWLAYAKLRGPVDPVELLAAEYELTDTGELRTVVLYVPGGDYAHVVPFGGESGGIAVCGCEPWLGENDDRERAIARSLPLCPTCARWAASLSVAR